VGADPRTDIAVLRIDISELHPAAITEHDVEQGDIVFAFGSPFGNEFSMSQGIVSGKGRQIGLLARQGGYENFIQTDAAINPGNSGGPLTNIYGQVVGMNTAIATRSGGSEGIGYVIPVHMVTRVVDQLIDTGRVSRGYLGIGIDELTPAMARSFGYEGRGILVTQPLADGPAAQAGVESGDIITAVDKQPLTSIEQFREDIAALPPGTTVTLTIFRDGQTREIAVQLGELPDQFAMATRPEESEPREVQPGRDMLLKLGFQRLTTLTPPIAQRLEVPPGTTGVLIGAVRPGSAAAAEGLQRGMVITHVMNEPIESVEQFMEVIAELDAAEGVRLRLMFGNNVRYVLLVLPED
jgi:serine protease Do